ncbi:Glycosyl transferase, family 2 [Crocosphaera watsonii WH 0003]|uniref:Glycosyl transferase, family 2 n=1 Tax=Crocosphaera watsonii WH 0003 TaxID=423471 RepID=G5JC08_CROWT|nr:Glycosyl transferase, family 2 [Crocosphaera watsonii WH 0003]
MFISVVIPTYNRKPILEKCLKALEKQQLNDDIISNYEIVLVDDGSTDGTLEWLQENKKKFTSCLCFFSRSFRSSSR